MIWGVQGVGMGSWILPELQEAAASLSPAVKLYSMTVRQDNSSFSTSCQSGLRAVCSTQKMDRRYPEETPIFTTLTFPRLAWPSIIQSITVRLNYTYGTPWQTRLSWGVFSPPLLQPQTKVLPSAHMSHGNRNDTFQHHSWYTHQSGQNVHPRKNCIPKCSRTQEESNTDNTNMRFPSIMEGFILKPYLLWVSVWVIMCSQYQ